MTSSIDSGADWAAARCVPGAGTGTLVRLGPVLLLADSADVARLEPLLDHAQMVAANGGEGRQLVRGFALQLATTNTDPPAFLAISPHASGLAVFISGDAVVTVDEETLDGADSLAWVERLFRWPIGRVEGRVGSGTTARGSAASPFDLRAGSVPADAFTMLPGSVLAVPATDSVVEAATPPDGALSLDKPADPVAAPQPDRPVPPPLDVHVPVEHRSVLLDGPEAEEELDLGPLPIPGDRVHQEQDPRVSLVNGVFCKNNHFNDPRVLFCAVCGINMVQQTPVLVQSGRPPLGVVVLDDGSVYQLDGDYLLGRDPDSDRRVAGGEFRSIPIQDQSQLISRVHARLELRGWDVVLIDNNSTNGTFYLEPGDQNWRQLPPAGEQALIPRSRIRLGNRSLAYDTTHHG
jgi:FHA domain